MSPVAGYKARFTDEAESDLVRLYACLLDSDERAAGRALQAIRMGLKLLEFTPYACRKVGGDSVYLREIILPFGAAGYVALYEIEPPDTVTVLAVRHQREDDYR